MGSASFAAQPTMSLQVSLASPAIRAAYEKVLDGVNDYVVLSYRKQTNDLDVAATGSGTLEDLAEELSDGKVSMRLRASRTQTRSFPSLCL